MKEAILLPIFGILAVMLLMFGLIYVQCKVTGLHHIVVGGNTVMCPR